MTDLLPMLIAMIAALVGGAVGTLAGQANGSRQWGLGGSGVGLLLGAALGIAVWAGHEGVYSPWRDGPITCLWVALAGGLLLVLRRPTGRGVALMGAIALGAVVLALHPMVGPGRFYPAWLDTWPLLLAGLLWAAATPFAEAGLARHRAGSAAVLAGCALMLTAGCLVLAHSAKLGQYTGMMVAAAAGVAVMGWWRGAPALGLGAAAHLVIGTSALLGTVYADLPRSAAVALALSMLTPWLVAFTPWRTRPVPRFALTLLAVALLGGSALAVTVISLARPASTSAAPYDYGY